MRGGGRCSFLVLRRARASVGWRLVRVRVGCTTCGVAQKPRLAPHELAAAEHEVQQQRQLVVSVALAERPPLLGQRREERTDVCQALGNGAHDHAAACGDALHAQLGDYVAANAGDRLWPEQASRVQGLLAEGRRAEAVEAYFGCVGARWDEERLITAVVPVDGRAGVA
jgi:hypothetical protein